ncbi:MAG: DUF2818 family protein [Gammaproteobacteria bacterium]
MGNTSAVSFLIVASLIAANIPWLSDRFMAVIRLERKNGWLRWLEWLLLYGLTGLLSAGLEYQLTGVRHLQDWEFYVTTFCLFAVFALPGFIYHYDLKSLLQKRKARKIKNG